jgi:type I restriction enzyme, R subunit
MNLNEKMIVTKTLSERAICTNFTTSAVNKSDWNRFTQLLDEVSFTEGKIYAEGKFAARRNQKHANCILYYKPNIHIAIIETKNKNHFERVGIQQDLDYVQIIEMPCVFSSCHDGFSKQNGCAADGNIETELYKTAG